MKKFNLELQDRRLICKIDKWCDWCVAEQYLMDMSSMHAHMHVKHNEHKLKGSFMRELLRACIALPCRCLLFPSHVPSTVIVINIYNIASVRPFEVQLEFAAFNLFNIV